MSVKGINLAQGLVWNAGQRRMIYHAMLAYLFVAGLLLAVTAYRATVKLQKGLAYGSEARAIQKKFSQAHPGELNMGEFAARLKARLDAESAVASSVQNTLPPTLYSTIPLLFMLSDPRNAIQLSRLNFEQTTAGGRPELIFSIMLPNDPSGGIPDMPAALRRWRNDPVLAREFVTIAPTTTERGSSRDGGGAILKYKAIFKEL